MMRVDDFDNQLHHRGQRKELPTTLPFRPCKIAEEVFVDLPELVPIRIDGNLREILEQRYENGVVDFGVCLRQNALKFFVVRLNGFHGLIDCFADVLPFRQRQQMREPSFRRQIHHAVRLIVFLPDRSPPRAFAFQLLFHLRKPTIGWRVLKCTLALCGSRTPDTSK